jgi:hypothetical protein
MNKKKDKTPAKTPISPPVSIETEILEAYSQLQYQKGASNIVLQDLANEAGVAFGTVRYHFNQAGRDVAQEALIYVVKKAYVYIDDQLFKARSEENFNPVKAYVKSMFNWIQQSAPDSSLLIYFYYLCSTKVSLTIPNQVFLERARLRIEALVHEAVGRKLYQPPADVSQVALQIHMTLLGGCTVAGTQRSDEQYQLQRDLCQDVIEQILRKN